MPRGRKKKAEDVQNAVPEAVDHELTEQEHEALLTRKNERWQRA